MKAKKFISAVCALAMTAASAATFVNAAGEEVIIKGDQVEAKSGADFTLNFNLDKFTGVGFSGCEFAITYDPAMLSDVTISEGAILKDTKATEEEIKKAPSIGSEVTMVNKKSYDCFDYNTVEKDGKNVIAVLWCTGLDSTANWVKTEGTLVTLKGKTAAGLEEGTKIPVNIVAIDRDGNKEMVFGYADGNKDVTYKSAVEKQGQITIVANKPVEPGTELTPLWGDVDDDGVACTARDIVAMKQFVALGNDVAKLNAQGITNGNLNQADGIVDVKDEKVLDMNDYKALIKLVLTDYTAADMPIKK